MTKLVADGTASSARSAMSCARPPNQWRHAAAGRSLDPRLAIRDLAPRTGPGAGFHRCAARRARRGRGAAAVHQAVAGRRWHSGCGASRYVGAFIPRIGRRWRVTTWKPRFNSRATFVPSTSCSLASPRRSPSRSSRDSPTYGADPRSAAEVARHRGHAAHPCGRRNACQPPRAQRGEADARLRLRSRLAAHRG